MRILLLTHAFNCLTQRLYVELQALGHEVFVEFDINDAVAREAVELAQPNLIVAPFLKRTIPADIWRHRVCLIVHPGPEGDRGPAALDWAILQGEPEWGVTVLQAEAELDAGPVWASRRFPLRFASKSSVYRNEVTTAAVSAVLEAVASYPAGLPTRPARHRWRTAPKPADRRIDWAGDDTETVLRKIHSADGAPGLRDSLFCEPVSLFDAQPAAGLGGEPGRIIARCGEAICRATRDGAVWIGHLRRSGRHALKLPAASVLGEPALADLPRVEGAATIRYEERQAVGYLHFPFSNGAMSTRQCEDLRAAYLAATKRDTRVIVLTGGPDFWSNGIHLTVIEAAASPADESCRNIHAMNDLCREIITTESHVTIAALQGNAGAGGVFLALATDQVIARDGVVLNPHYKGMGNLYGSEYWTYLLPRRCGLQKAVEVTQSRLPMGAAEAKRLRLIDEIFPESPGDFLRRVEDRARKVAASPGFADLLARKRQDRLTDEAAKPLQRYRDEELEHLKLNFYGFDPSYHVARYNFVHKIPKSRTPLYLARHRNKAAGGWLRSH